MRTVKSWGGEDALRAGIVLTLVLILCLTQFFLILPAAEAAGRNFF
jgi:hypothetical protein